MRRCARGAERGWTMKMEDGGSRMRWMEDGGWNRVLAPPRPSPHGCCARLHGSEGLARTLPGWMADGERADGCPLCAADVDRSNPSRMHACSLDECNSRAKDTRRGSVLTLQLLLSLSAPSPQPLLQGPPLGLQARKAHPNQPHLADPHRGCAHARRCQVLPWKAARVRLPRLEGDQRQQRPRHLGQGVCLLQLLEGRPCVHLLEHALTPLCPSSLFTGHTAPWQQRCRARQVPEQPARKDHWCHRARGTLHRLLPRRCRSVSCGY